MHTVRLMSSGHPYYRAYFDVAVIRAAELSLPSLLRHEPSPVCDALRWVVINRDLQASYFGAVVVPLGILMYCTTTYIHTDSAYFVPWALAASPCPYQCLHELQDPLMNSLTSMWAPAHKPIETAVLCGLAVRMLNKERRTALSAKSCSAAYEPGIWDSSPRRPQTLGDDPTI